MTGRKDIDVSPGSATLRWPYSQAVAAGGLVLLAGQIGVRGTTIAEQAAEAYRRVGHYLAEAGATPDDVVKETIYLVDNALLADVAKVHNAFYSSHWPVTTTVITGRNGGPELEVEVIAVPGAGA
jgi:enamine deaminase RidA (YjgF/YER057c/UK114 family)